MFLVQIMVHADCAKPSSAENPDVLLEPTCAFAWTRAPGGKTAPAPQLSAWLTYAPVLDLTIGATGSFPCRAAAKPREGRSCWQNKMALNYHEPAPSEPPPYLHDIASLRIPVNETPAIRDHRDPRLLPPVPPSPTGQWLTTHHRPV